MIPGRRAQAPPPKWYGPVGRRPPTPQWYGSLPLGINDSLKNERNLIFSVKSVISRESWTSELTSGWAKTYDNHVKINQSNLHPPHHTNFSIKPIHQNYKINNVPKLPNKLFQSASKLYSER